MTPLCDDLHSFDAASFEALMAAADTATVIAISAARSAFVPMTTVQLSTTFQRPIAGVDVQVLAKVTKLGRTLAFADITLTPHGASAPAAQAQTGAARAAARTKLAGEVDAALSGADRAVALLDQAVEVDERRRGEPLLGRTGGQLAASDEFEDLANGSPGHEATV